ncbi:MAG: S46 family peptidase [Bacteroidales bacterium]
MIKNLVSKILLALVLTMGIYQTQAFPVALPDEGMWLPMFVDRLYYTDLQKKGLKLTPEELYSINHSSLKDAVVGLAAGSQPEGYFCTGEIVSDQGLVFTNHHCGYSYIQEHSTLENDILTNGFWAMSFEEELPNPGLTASILVRMEDVTRRVLEHVTPDMSEDAREEAISKAMEEIKKEASENGKYNCTVKSFFFGNEFYLFVYQTYLDVRLVGTPPSSIGKFGGDTDNWMWPRHTGDFSIFRIYTAPDGSPAPYSKDNVPLKPKHFLPISLKGVQKDDYAMIWGFPGSTDRFMTSWGVEQAINETNPTIVKIRDLKLKIMKEDMDADPRINLMYAAKYAQTSNYWKYFIGQTRGLKRLNVAEQKRKIEDQFLKWAGQNPERQAQYGEALEFIRQGMRQQAPYVIPQTYMMEAVFQGPEILLFAMRTSGLYDLLEKAEKAKGSEKEELDKKITATIERIKKRAADFYKDYNAPTDQKLFAGLMQLYYNNVGQQYRPDIFQRLEKKYKGDFNRWAEEVYSKSIFASQEKLNEFLAHPSAKKMAKDPAFDMAAKVRSYYMGLMAQNTEPEKIMNKGYRLFVDGLRQMNPEKFYAPDANSTLRMTYGSVLDYYPADAVHYDLVTTLTGVMEKEDPSNPEFVVDAKLKELYEKKDFGRYGVEINGKKDIITCFLTNTDITGGNSGSPVINANGQLIGIAFDGNWEAMSGDIAFEPNLQRTISVDIRYVLFIIDKLGGCQRLIDELNIVQ